MRSINVHIKESKLLIFTVILLILNTALIVIIAINMLNNPGTENNAVVMTRLEQKKEYAEEIVEYNLRTAQKLGVDQRPQVREALSRFFYEISLASGHDELIRVIQSNGRSIQEIILREYEDQQQDLIVALVNQDSRVREMLSRDRITLVFDNEDGILVEPEGVLGEDTLDRISELAFHSEFPSRQTFELEVEDGQAGALVTHNPLDRIQALTKEVDSLRTALYDTRVNAGLAELPGAGVIIKLYDAEEGHTSETIVHDSDIRDIVNELFAIGAQGVAIGDQRLTATSSIRCVGPTIRVNDRSISVNPVVIKAVGNPEILESGLDVFSIIFSIYGGLRLEIERVDNLILPSFSASAS